MTMTAPTINKAARNAALAACLIACGGGLACCAASIQPKSSRLAADDFDLVSAELAAKLAASDFLDDRAPDSPVIIIAVSKVENLTTDLLSEGEKWYLVDRALDSLAMNDLKKTKAIRFVIPAEKLAMLRKTIGPDEQVAADRAPTHTLTARLRSVTRAAGADRTDLYDCEFRIVEITSGEIVWSDSAALKRIARGKAYN
jgi:hypothetical protein